MAEIDDYDYPLPKELIAQEPLARRSDARLMLVDRGRQSIDHFRVRNLPALLNRRDCLALNNTRVLPARLVGVRTQTGGRWFGLFLGCNEQGLWRLLAKTRGHIQPGETVMLLDREGRGAVSLRLAAKLTGGEWIAAPDSTESAAAILGRIGRVPLPHYIRGGEMVDRDLETYQTVFAQKDGAVAAPTAGLHFTPELLHELQAMGVERCELTLHVGIGTFRPVTAETFDEHRMHAEWGELSQAGCSQLQSCRQNGGRIVAVGTTAVRTLETAAADGELQPWQGETSLFIRPGHTFRAVDVLLTNFHLPKSTLLVLVRTFGGDALIREAYEVAVREKYRFFSYGDAMLIV